MYLRTQKVSNWKQINYRNVDSMLSVQFIYDLYDQYSSTINWFRFKNVCLYYQNNKLWSFTPTDEWEKALDNIAKQFINPKQNSNPNIIKKCYWYYNRKETLLEKFLKKNSKIDLSKLSDQELFDLLFNWYQITINQIYFINLAPVELGLQRAISNLHADKYLTSDEISILYSLDNNTAVIKEEYAFLKKIYSVGSTISKEQLIDSHLSEYGYVTIGYGSKPLDRNLLCSRYDKLIAMDKKSIKKRIDEIENYPNFIKQQKEKIYDKLNNNQLAELFDLAAKLGYMRDRKKAYLGKSVEYRNTIFEEISSRKKIDIEKIKYYIMEDFDNLLVNGIQLSDDEIEERKKGIYISNVSNMYSGETARENYFSSVKVEKEDINTLNVRKGVCASPGVIRGKARVCLSFEESNNLKSGEILVTYGTDFDFMNAIVKSKGIITEEGGILSHASVISRELKKPCIIAFKGITKILKTGDTIELDAEKGTVKLLESVDSNEEERIVGFYKLGDKISAKEIGNKAFNLSELYNLNCNVPEAYFLGVSFFENILKEQNKYEEYIKYSDNLEKYKDDIYNLIDNINIPKNILTKLDFEKNTYAVRSSSPNEDGKAKSFAGQYVTELFCNSEEFTIKSIKKCWKSLLGVGLESYQGDDINTRFGGIVLQKMITADFAGVMFTKNPVSNNKDCIIIEACKGVASKLVDNRVVPDRYFINQENLEITASTSTINNISEEIIKKLASIGKDLEQKYGCDVDIEWACENNIIYIIQCRPITT